MNGNSAVDWKDVKILQSFFDLGEADVNLDGLVDFTDFRTLRDHYSLSGQTFIQGDLTGDDLVTFADFQVLESGYGFRSNLLGLDLTPAPFIASEWNDFLASVPEPSTGLLAFIAAAGLLRRRRGASPAKASS
jgi:hypothetical protein